MLESDACEKPSSHFSAIAHHHRQAYLRSNEFSPSTLLVESHRASLSLPQHDSILGYGKRRHHTCVHSDY